MKCQLKLILDEIGMTQKQLAEKVNVSPLQLVVLLKINLYQGQTQLSESVKQYAERQKKYGYTNKFKVKFNLLK